MKNQIKKSVTTLLIVIACLFNLETTASHIAGINMRYDYVGQDPNISSNVIYKITVTAYRFCTGSAYTCGARGQEIYAKCTSSGAQLGPITLTQKSFIARPGDRPNFRGARDVSNVCKNQQTSCEVRGGVNGYEAYLWEGQISLPKCTNWQIAGTSCTCCSNGFGNIWSGGGGNNIWVIDINTNWSPAGSSTASKNCAPKFFNEDRPFPNACVGQKIVFAGGAFDNDGDSLRYQMVCPWSAVGSAGRPAFTRMTPRGAGISCSTPMPGFTIDGSTGLMTVTPTTVGGFLCAYEVAEYERCTGLFKGRSYREIVINVATCANKVPVDKSGISNITGRATLITPYKLEVCNGDLITWDDTLIDPDRGDTLKVLTNLNSIMPNAKMDIISTGQRNSIVVRFTWRAVMGKDPIKHFFISFSDDNCGIPGNGHSSFELDVKSSISAGVEQYVCKGDTVFLKGFGSNLFKWKSLNGNPLVTGVNWFPDTNIGVDTNKFVKFVPIKTTTLLVEASSARDLCGGIVQSCFLKDTMTINVSQAYQIKVPNDSLICYPAAGSLTVNPSKNNLKYTYKWSPNGTLNDDTLKSPRFSNVLRNTKYNVTVTSDSGCVREDSIQVNVTNPFPQNMRVMASDTLICLQDTIGMWVNTGSINYGSCDTSTYPCLGKSVDKTLGSGSVRTQNGQANAPAIYASRNRSLRVQFLYTAADLKSKGIGAGPITSVAFNIVQLGNQGANPFNGFTIKMGCTSLTKMVATFVPSLKVVSDAKSHIPVLGWNTHAFDRDYVWDGSSNLLVEICWDNGPTTYAWDHIMTLDVTSYESSIRYYSNVANSPCNVTTPTGAAMFLLPHAKFGVCSGIDNANFKFQWVPDPITTNGGFLSATNKDSTNASVNLVTAGKYKAFVSDTSGVCFDTLDLKINVVQRYSVKPDSLPLQCVSSGGIIQLTSPTPHTISTPGGKWTGVGITNSSLGYWSPAISGKGRFPVTYSVTGNACANSGTTFLNITGLPDASILSPDSACGSYGNDPRHELVPRTSGGYFSGFGIDSVISTVPPFNKTYFIDGTKFNPTSGSTDTVRVKYKVHLGCWNDSIVKIPVVAPFDTTYLGVISNGAPIYTTEFCSTIKSDTVVAAGKGGIWRSFQYPSGLPSAAMVDTNRGIFNPRLVNNGAGGQAYIEVSRSGFCGATGRYVVDVFVSPEVRVLPENYCFSKPGDCVGSNVPASDRKKLIKVRIAKSPFKKINESNPNTYVDVITASRSTTGWNSVVESDKITKWNGNPWMTFPYKCEYPFCQLPKGRYPISYQLGMNYRLGQNIQDSICYSYHDTAIFINDKWQTTLVPDGDLCTKASVIVTAYPQGTKFSYKWSDGSKTSKITSNQAGAYSVTVSSAYCSAIDSITLSYCTGLEELETPLNAQLFPNPTRDYIHLKMGHIKEGVTLSIFTMTGQLVDEFNFDAETGKVEADINVSRLPAGVYSFRVSNSSKTNTYRVVIE